jgi:hypothetical protein
MKLRIIPLTVLIICACAFASVAVAFSSIRLNSVNVKSNKLQSAVQINSNMNLQLLGEEIDTPTIPRTPT